MLRDPAANASEEASVATDQPATDAVTGVDSVQDANSDGSPTGSGFEAVEQSSVVQHSAVRPDVPQQTQVLHVCLGSLPDMHASCTAFYFLRNQPGNLTIEDMDTQIDCGILSEGPSLKMLRQVMLMQTLMHSSIICFVQMLSSTQDTMQQCYLVCSITSTLECLTEYANADVSCRSCPACLSHCSCNKLAGTSVLLL